MNDVKKLANSVYTLRQCSTMFNEKILLLWKKAKNKETLHVASVVLFNVQKGLSMQWCLSNKSRLQ